MNQKILICLVALVITSCENPNKKSGAQVNLSTSDSTNANVDALLARTYNSMLYSFHQQANLFALGETATDEFIPATCGADWDENGAWRVLHTHNFEGGNTHIEDVFDGLAATSFAATNILQFNPTPRQAAETKYLRAFAQYLTLDLFDQVPYREPNESAAEPAKVRKGTEALTHITSELEAIIPDLPEGPVVKANKNAARVLLMKCYLNKGVYANRQTPAFNTADMQKVIYLADKVIAAPYSFSTNYFDKFVPNNNAINKESIWTAENIRGDSSAVMRSQSHLTMHYSQAPPGGDGSSTLTSAFAPEIKNSESDKSPELNGTQPFKYPIRFQFDDNGNIDNDYVYFRLTDVLFMKAEAMLRSGNAVGALKIVNQIRANRAATPLATLTLDNLIDDRGREMCRENWRRQDLIRFGKFLQPLQERTRAADPKYLLFPIPNGQLAVNPNLTLNPGY